MADQTGTIRVADQIATLAAAGLDEVPAYDEPDLTGVTNLDEVAQRLFWAAALTGKAHAHTYGLFVSRASGKVAVFQVPIISPWTEEA